jgi:hypothetical protein
MTPTPNGIDDLPLHVSDYVRHIIGQQDQIIGVRVTMTEHNEVPKTIETLLENAAHSMNFFNDISKRMPAFAHTCVKNGYISTATPEIAFQARSIGDIGAISPQRCLFKNTQAVLIHYTQNDEHYVGILAHGGASVLQYGPIKPATAMSDAQ